MGDEDFDLFQLKSFIKTKNSQQFRTKLSEMIANQHARTIYSLLDKCAAQAIRSQNLDALSHTLSITPEGRTLGRTLYTETYFAATEVGVPAALDMLFAAGLDPIHEPSERSPNFLSAAISYGNLAAVKHIFALPRNPPVKPHDAVPGMCSHYLDGVAHGRGDAAGTLRFLLEQGAGKDLPGSFALHCAAQSGTISVMEILVNEAGVDIDDMPQPDQISTSLRWFSSKSDRYGTPLHWAADSRNIDGVRWLLDHGADPHKKDAKGRTLLTRSEYLGKPPSKVWGKLVEELKHRDIKIQG